MCCIIRRVIGLDWIWFDLSFGKNESWEHLNNHWYICNLCKIFHINLQMRWKRFIEVMLSYDITISCVHQYYSLEFISDITSYIQWRCLDLLSIFIHDNDLYIILYQKYYIKIWFLYQSKYCSRVSEECTISVKVIEYHQFCFYICFLRNFDIHYSSYSIDYV